MQAILTNFLLMRTERYAEVLCPNINRAQLIMHTSHLRHPVELEQATE
jgi:hypothetical protein